VRRDLWHVTPFTTAQLDALWLFDRDVLAPLLEPRDAAPANSDYFPCLELGAERARFSPATPPALLLRHCRISRCRRADRTTGSPYRATRRGHFRLEPIHDALRAACLRRTIDNPFWPGDIPDADWAEPLERYRALRSLMASGRPRENWREFIDDVQYLDDVVHAGTAGAADSALWTPLLAYVQATSAGPEPRAALAFMHALRVWD
jgi:hypothetical protein